MSIIKNKISIFLLLCTLLVGCAYPNQMNTTQKSSVYGTVAGGALGALAGELAGHNTRSTLYGAAIGSAIGGLAGYGIGNSLQKQKEELQTELAGIRGANIEEENKQLKLIFSSQYMFKPGSAILSPAAYSNIERVTRILKEYPQDKIRIEGYTDSSGNERYNLRLSLRRAQAVANVLISYGIPGGRISVMGFGESNPIASNSTLYGRMLNRRVEIHLY